MSNLQHALASFRQNITLDDIKKLDPNPDSAFQQLVKRILSGDDIGSELEVAKTQSLTGLLLFITSINMSKDGMPQYTYFESIMKTYINAYNRKPGSEIFDSGYLNEALPSQIACAMSACDLILKVIPLTDTQKRLLEFCRNSFLFSMYETKEDVPQLDDLVKSFNLLFESNYFDMAQRAVPTANA